jgi:hypothetical protein
MPWDVVDADLWQFPSVNDGVYAASQALEESVGQASTFSPMSFPGIPADQVEAYTSNVTDSNGFVALEQDCVVVRDGAMVEVFLFTVIAVNTQQVIDPAALQETEQSIVSSVTQ